MLFDFTGRNETELSVSAGDVIRVISLQDDWCYAAKADGSEGYVPTNYIEHQ